MQVFNQKILFHTLNCHALLHNKHLFNPFMKHHMKQFQGVPQIIQVLCFLCQKHIFVI